VDPGSCASGSDISISENKNVAHVEKKPVTGGDAPSSSGDASECGAPVVTPRHSAPSSPDPQSSSKDARLKVHLAQLQIEADERERRAEKEFRLQIRKMEIEADKEVRLNVDS